MAITRYVGNELTGLSSDTKPTNIPDGARFFETDTLKIYIKVSGTWQPVIGYSGVSGYSGYSGVSGYSGYSGSSVSGYSGYSGAVSTSGYSGAASGNIIPSGLVSWWQFNELAWVGTTGEVKDSIGSVNLKADSSVTLPKPVSFGRIGNGGYFSEVGNSLRTTSDTPLRLSSGTYSAWIKCTGTPSSPMLIIDKSGQTEFGVYTDGKLFVYNGTYTYSTPTVNDGRWHHIAYTYTSGGSFMLYLDGSNSGVSGTLGTLTQNGEFYIGLDFVGLIDEVCFWNRVLSAQEVNNLMTLSPPLPLTEGYAFEYLYDTSVTSAAPTSYLRYNNNSVVGSVTNIYVNMYEINVKDMTHFLNNLEYGDLFKVSSLIKNKYDIFKVIGNPTFSSNVYTIPVSYIAGTNNVWSTMEPINISKTEGRGLIADAILTSANTQLDSDGNVNNLLSQRSWDVEITIYNSTAGAVSYNMYIDTDGAGTMDTTTANYSSSVGGSWGSTAVLLTTVSASAIRTVRGTMSINSLGYCNFLGSWVENPTDTSNLIYWKRDSTVTNVSKIRIYTTTGSGIGIGSRIRIWKK